MKHPPLFTFRLLVETLAVVAGVGCCIVLAMTHVASSRNGAATVPLCASALVLMAGPLLLRRSNASRRRRRPGPDEQTTTDPSLSRAKQTAAGASIAVLVIGLACSVVAAAAQRSAEKHAARARFDRLTERLRVQAGVPFARCHVGLSGIRGLWEATRSVERDEFRQFVSSQSERADFPGVRWFGVVQRVSPERLDEFVAGERADSAPGFDVRPVGNSQDLYVLKFVEPVKESGRLMGIDIGSDVSCRVAAEQAMLTGEAALSGPIVLDHGGSSPSPLLYLLPLYSKGRHPTTPEDRRRDLVGWACAAVAMQDAFAGLTSIVGDRIELEVYGGDGEKPLFDSDGAEHGARGATASAFALDGELDVGGRKFRLWMGSTPMFDAETYSEMPLLIGAGGAFISLLLAAIAWGLGTARAQALVLATEMTANLRDVETRARASTAKILAYRRMLDQYAIVAVTDAAGTIIEANDPFCRVSGYTREELVGANHSMLNSGHHPKQFWVQMWKVVARGGVWRAEVCNKAKNGSLYWVDTTIGPLHGEDGKVCGYISVRFDITERKRAVIKAVENEAKFRALFECSPVGIMLSDYTTGRCAEGNDVLFEVTGYTVQELQQLPFESLTPPEYAEVEAAQRERLRTHGAYGPYEKELVRKDGSRVAVVVHGSLIKSGDGRRMVWSIIQDVTQRKKADAELAMALETAEDANRAKGEFLANMSHEIRTPMTAILGYADLLRDDQGEPLSSVKRSEVVDTIAAAGRHLLKIISDILDLSKIEAGRMTVESVQSPLPDILKEVVGLLRPTASAKGLAIELHFGTALPAFVTTDPTRLRQILLNLAGNAVKFTERGKVSVTARAEGVNGSRRLVIEVQDTGPGLSSQQQARLFKPFSQADTAVTRRHGGTGLGLTISRRMARLMGGEVALIRSGAGEGSCFRVDLPLEVVAGSELVVDAASSAAAPAARVTASGAPFSGRILLAEDGPDNQRLISFHLRKAGAAVDIADNGRVALQMLEDALVAGKPYDLLVTDMQMPEMDGYTLALTLRAKGALGGEASYWRGLPVIALTAHAMHEDRQKCLDAGCDDYATKPIDKAQLVSMCARHIARARAAA